MIKVDVAALKPAVSKFTTAAKTGAIALGATLPVALAKDVFEGTTQKTDNKKLQFEFCSDFCMEVLG